MVPSPIGNLVPIAVSDNGSVLGYDQDAGALSVLVNGSKKTLKSCIPPQYQNMISFPVNPSALPSGWINDKGDVVVPALLLNPNGNGVGNPLWIYSVVMITNIGSTDIGTPPALNIIYNAGNSSSNATLFNNNDVFVGLDYNAATDTMDAMAQIPVSLSVTPRPGSGDWVDGASQLLGPDVDIQATYPLNAAAFHMTVKIVQDIKALATVTYDDQSWTYLQSGPDSNSYDFMSDDNADNPPVPGTANGKATLTLSDQPRVTMTTAARQHLLQVQYSAQLRDFLTVQIGNGAPQSVTELNWSFQANATFTPATKMTTGAAGVTFPTKFQGNKSIVPIPPFGSKGYGEVPTDKQIQSRSPAFNQILTEPSYWHPTGALASQDQYKCPVTP